MEDLKTQTMDYTDTDPKIYYQDSEQEGFLEVGCLLCGWSKRITDDEVMLNPFKKDYCLNCGFKRWVEC